VRWVGPPGGRAGGGPGPAPRRSGPAVGPCRSRRGARGVRSLGTRGGPGGARARASLLRPRPRAAGLDAPHTVDRGGAPPDRNRVVGARRVRRGMTTAFVLAAVVAAAPRPDLLVWRLESGRVAADSGAPQGPLPVGSLVKPFLAEAWARAHPGETPPRATCDERSRCWRPSGHGTLGLARALAVSCNTYFARLAADVPAERLAEILREEGFVVEGPLGPSAALGLDGNADAPTIEPTALLLAYERLVRQPWAAEEEAVRGEVLAGLRESARVGTTRAARAVLGKTGTVPSLRGLPQRTSGWALVATGSGTLRL